MVLRLTGLARFFESEFPKASFWERHGLSQLFGDATFKGGMEAKVFCFVIFLFLEEATVFEETELFGDTKALGFGKVPVFAGA